MSHSLHNTRFPNESAEYRDRRDELLRAELELRAQTEKVSAMRRELPTGGAIPEDYEFRRVPPVGGDKVALESVRMSELFADGHESLILYNFMFGPDDEHPCFMCSSLLDSLNGVASHASQRVSMAMVVKSTPERVHPIAEQRGWDRLTLVSSAGNSYNADYHGELPSGQQMPACNVFVKRDDNIYHFWSAEVLFANTDGHPRHMDPVWPLWNLLDLTPTGRGTDWYPQLSY